MLFFSRFERVAACAALAIAAMVALACGGKTPLDSTSGSGTGGDSSDAGTSCEELNAEYLQQFELARACSPEQNVSQCTAMGDTELFCPCPRFINPANGAAVARLSDLHAAWAAKSCPPMTPVCDAGICPIADAGICVPQPQGSPAPGLCQDKF